MSQPDQSGAGWVPAIFSANQGAAAQGNVRGAIARAAQSSGVDFSYLLAQARLESSLNPNARAATSSATGLYQFTDATWLHTLRRHGGALNAATPGFSSLGNDPLASFSDPAARQRLLAMRYDPQISATMAAHLAADNQATLTTRLGRTPDASEMYLAHFLGADGAVKFLGALAQDPSQSAAALNPKAAASNRAIFFDASGNARSLGQVMDLLRGRMANAMQADGDSEAALMAGDLGNYGAMTTAVTMPAEQATPAAADTSAMGPIARQFAAAAGQDFAGASDGAGASAPGQGSMADAIRHTFDSIAEATGTSTPDSVRTAYQRLGAMGL